MVCGNIFLFFCYFKTGKEGNRGGREGGVCVCGGGGAEPQYLEGCHTFYWRGWGGGVLFSPMVPVYLQNSPPPPPPPHPLKVLKYLVHPSITNLTQAFFFLFFFFPVFWVFFLCVSTLLAVVGNLSRFSCLESEQSPSSATQSFP